MPDIQDLIAQKLSRIDSVPESLFTSVERTQRAILKELQALLNTLQTSEGRIRFTTSNLEKIEEISQRVQDLMFTGEYQKAVLDFGNAFTSQAALNNNILSGQMNASIPRNSNYTAIIRESQRNAIELLSRTAVEQRFIDPLRNALRQSITTQGGISETIDVMRQLTVGTQDRNGLLLGERFKQQVSDAFAVSDREYTLVISRDLGAEFYMYAGGLLKDSRCFCVQRDGNIYHRGEIETWGRPENAHLWDKTGKDCDGGGRMSTTTPETIFTTLGGWNCKHSILPYATSAVPPEVIEKAKAAGFYKG